MEKNQELERLASEIVDAAVVVHRMLGPGLLESAYQTCLFHELTNRGLSVRREVPVPVQYRGRTVGCGYRLDMLVEGQVIIENKVMPALTKVCQAQLITYLKLTGCKLGFLINWNVTRIKDGIKRMVLKLEED